MRTPALPPAAPLLKRALAVALLGAAVATCRDLPTGPGGKYAAKLAVYPAFPESFSLEGTSLVIDTVRLRLRRGDGSTVLDTAVFFPPSQDTLVIEPTVPLDAPAEQFSAQMQLKAGATTLFQGTRSVTASSSGAATAPVAIPTPYIGPGAGITRLDASPGDSALAQGDTISLRVETFDAQNQPVTNRLLVFTSSDTTRATVSPSGVVRGLARGPVTIRVRTPDNKRDSVSLLVTPTPTRTTISGGLGQPVVAGAASSALAVQVLDQSGVAVQGVTVSWSVRDGGGSVSAPSLTNAEGIAVATYTAGFARGGYSVVAKSPRLADSAVFAGTIRAAAPARVEALRGNSQQGTVGETLADSLVTRVLDAFGNPVDGVNVKFTATAGLLSDTLRVADDSGRAGVRWTLGTVAGAASVTARVDTAQLTFVATALVGPLDSLRFEGSRALSFASLTDTARLVVRTLDRFGNEVPATAFTWFSTDTTVARVDLAGLVRSHGNGTAQIIAVAGGRADTASVTVSQVPVHVTVSPSSPQVNAGARLQMSAVVTDARFSPLLDPAIVWSSDRAAVASIDATTGLVTALDSGSTTIRATVGAVEGTQLLHVMPAALATGCGDGVGTVHAAGTRIADETWTRAGSPHRISGVVLFSAASLRIEAGAMVCGDPASALTVNGGSLLAEGTATLPITFRAADVAQGWGGIVIHYPDSSEISHARIEHAGHPYVDNGTTVTDGSALEIYGDNSRVRVSDVTIRQAYRRAITAYSYYWYGGGEVATSGVRALPGADLRARDEAHDRSHVERREARQARSAAMREALRKGGAPKSLSLAQGKRLAPASPKGAKGSASVDPKKRKADAERAAADQRIRDRIASVRAVGERFRTKRAFPRGAKSLDRGTKGFARGAKSLAGAPALAHALPVQLTPMNLLDESLRIRLVRVRVDTTVTGGRNLGYGAVNLYGAVSFDSSHVVGASHAGLHLYGDSITLRDDTVMRSGEAGVVSEYGTSLTARSGNVVSTQNGLYPFFGEGQAFGRLVRSAADLDRFRGNARDTVLFYAVNLYDGDTLVLHKGMPYAVEYDMNVAGAARLEIRPGVRIAMGAYSDIDVYGGGALHAVGTPTDSIVLAAREPGRPWYGVYVDGTGGGRLAVARIEDAYYAFDLYNFGATPFEVDSVLVSRARESGGYAYGNARLLRTTVDTVARDPAQPYWSDAVLEVGDSVEVRDVTVRGAPESGISVESPRVLFTGLRVEGWGRRSTYTGVPAFEVWGDSVRPESAPPRVTGAGPGPQVEMTVAAFRALFPTDGLLDSIRSGFPGRDTVALYANYAQPIRSAYVMPGYAATPESPLNVVLSGVMVRGSGAELRVGPGTKLHGYYGSVVADSGARVHIEGTAAHPVRVLPRGSAIGLCFTLAGSPSDTSRFVHTLFEKNGGTCGQGGLIATDAQHPVVVDRSTFRHNAYAALALGAPGSRIVRTTVDSTTFDYGVKFLGSGISMDSSAVRGAWYGAVYVAAPSTTISRSDISGNQYYGVRVAGTATSGVVLSQNHIYANAQEASLYGRGLYVEGATGITVDARDNWWGSATGPGPSPSGDVYAPNGATILAADSGDYRTAPTGFWPAFIPSSVSFALAGVELAGDTIRVASRVDTTALGVVIRDAQGSRITGYPQFTVIEGNPVGRHYFLSDRSSVVTDGEGYFKVRVSYLGHADTAVVAVRQLAAAIDVYPRTAGTMPGGSFRFQAAAYDSNGHQIPRLRDSVTWSAAGATVDAATGFATASVTPGTATISATYGNITGARDWAVTTATANSCAVAEGTVLEMPGTRRHQASGWAVTSSATLPAAGAPYRFPQGISVDSSAVLTLEPGTLFCGGDYASIQVGAGLPGGRIVAEGTAAKPIHFRLDSLGATVPSPWTTWGGIALYRDSSSFRHVRIEQADVPLQVQTDARVAVDSSLLRTYGSRALEVRGRAHVNASYLERPEGGYIHSPTGAWVAGPTASLTLRGSVVRGMYQGIEAHDRSTLVLRNDSIIASGTRALYAYSANVHVDTLAVRGSGGVYYGTASAVMEFADTTATLTFGTGGWSITANQGRPLLAPAQLLARIAEDPARLEAMRGNANDQIVVAGGRLTADTLAVTQAQPWFVTQDVFVRDGGLLRMEPGATTTIASNVSIHVQTGGQLRSVGTPSNQVRIVPHSGRFRTIAFWGTQAASDTNLIRHTHIQGGGYGWGADTSAAAVAVLGGRAVTIDSSRISQSQLSAIAIRASSATDSTVIRHVAVDTVTDRGHGIQVSSGRAVIVGTTVRRTAARPGIGIYNGHVRLTADTVIDAQSDGIYVDASSTVLLEAGHVGASSGAGLRMVGAATLAAGSTGPRITASVDAPFYGSYHHLKALYPTIADQETRLAGNARMEVGIFNTTAGAPGTRYEVAPSLPWHVLENLVFAGEGTTLAAGAGTSLLFENNRGLSFGSGARTLLAGSATAPVQLRPAIAGGGWAGIDLGGTPAAASTIRNAYVSRVSNTARAAVNTATTHAVEIDSLLMVGTGTATLPTQAIALRATGSSLRRTIVDTVSAGSLPAVSIEGASTVVDSVIVRRASGFGLRWAVPGTGTALSNVAFIDNGAGVEAGPTTSPGTITNGYFSGNAGLAVNNNGGSNPTLTATNAWWGADADPLVGSANGVSGAVEFGARRTTPQPLFSLFTGLSFPSVIAGASEAPATRAVAAPAAGTGATLRGGR